MKVDIITLFPDMVNAAFSESILKRAKEEQLLEINAHQLRNYSEDKRKRVDDTTYGGGSGMLLRVEPVKRAIEDVASPDAHVIYMSPRGRKLDQEKVIELSEKKHLVILCGHYEGVDQRVIDSHVDEELSIGDYVLTGGELAAVVLVDAVSRYVDGVLGKDHSLVEESFENHLLEYPQYTKPREVSGQEVPEVLLSGNHQKIDFWRYSKSLELTYTMREDLFYKHVMDVLSKGKKNDVRKLSDAIKTFID